MTKYRSYLSTPAMAVTTIDVGDWSEANEQILADRRLAADENIGHPGAQAELSPRLLKLRIFVGWVS